MGENDRISEAHGTVDGSHAEIEHRAKPVVTVIAKIVLRKNEIGMRMNEHSGTSEDTWVQA